MNNRHLPSLRHHFSPHSLPGDSSHQLPRRPLPRWIGLGVVCAAALLALPPAWSQAQGAGALFEGRPAMGGAQGGQGAQAGMPQGGLGVQGSEGQKGLVLRKPTGLDSIPPLPAKDAAKDMGRDPGMNTVGTANTDMQLKPGKSDKGLASEQRSSLSRAKRAAKNTAKRARTGVSNVDSVAVPGGTPK